MDFARQILTLIQSPRYRPLRTRELARELRVRRGDWPEFLETLGRLESRGQVEISRSGQVRSPRGTGSGRGSANSSTMAGSSDDDRRRNSPQRGIGTRGTLRRTKSGAGLFLPDEEPVSEPWWVPPEELADAFSGDVVFAEKLGRTTSSGQPCARVLEVISRAMETFVGTYFEARGQGWVVLDGGHVDTPIAVGDPGAKGARPQDKVVIEMVVFPRPGRAGEAVITRVLGARGETGVDTMSILVQFGIPHEFSEDVLADARAAAHSFHEQDLTGRLDLTNETIITIDPVDARDFDDAISLRRTDEGHWQLGVHIADVSHFVPEGSAIDDEARRRGTSVYLPDLVVPMLPEVLSNALASLQAGHVRFTLSALLELDATGMVRSAEFARSAIRVTRRFAYEEVFALLQDEHRSDTASQLANPVAGHQPESDHQPADEASTGSATAPLRAGAINRSASQPSEDAEFGAGLLSDDEPAQAASQSSERAVDPAGTLAEPLTPAVDAQIPAVETPMVEEVIAVADAPDDEGEHVPPMGTAEPVPPEIRQLLAEMYELAMCLRRRRFRQGALELDLPEIKIDLNRNGTVTGAHRVAHDFSHQMIEEFMLIANVAVARRLNELNIPFLRRIHGSPDEVRMQEFAKFVGPLGYKLTNPQSRSDLQRLLRQARGQPTEFAVHYGLLRRLRQAEYSPLDEGHYALAEDDYCHFTSPIRRYPDLTVHRLLIAVLEQARVPQGAADPRLIELGKHCSKTERRAESAERELIRVKLLTFMARRIGWELNATVTGVERFGMFLTGVELPAEGMIHVTGLPRDLYDFDGTAHALIGRRSGLQFRLGDCYRVKVAAVDLVKRTLDFELIGRGERVTNLGPIGPHTVTADNSESTDDDADQGDGRRLGDEDGGPWPDVDSGPNSSGFGAASVKSDRGDRSFEASRKDRRRAARKPGGGSGAQTGGRRSGGRTGSSAQPGAKPGRKGSRRPR